jgi:hypothetical protein
MNMIEKRNLLDSTGFCENKASFGPKKAPKNAPFLKQKQDFHAFLVLCC